LRSSDLASSHVAASPYAISVNGAAASDYTIKYADGTLTVTPAPLTITADNQSMVYGSTVPALTASYSGLVNNDTSASFTTPPALATTATSGSHVAGGPYAITAAGAVDPDYAINYADGNLMVTPAPLTISAAAQSKIFGQSDPTLSYQVNGLQSTDTATSVVSGMPSRSAGDSVSGSPYAITQGTLKANSDYTLAFKDSSLSIKPDSTTTILQTSAVNVPSGQSVTLTAMVEPTVSSSDTESGSVVFSDQGTTLATVPVTNGTATFTTSTLSVGDHAITAAYVGDANHSVSTSP